MALDHGELNVPLAKRGNIDAQLDRYKADRQREDRAAARTAAGKLKTQRAQAADVLVNIPEARIAELAAGLGMTAAALSKQLSRWAYWEPAKVIAIGEAERRRVA